MTDSVREQIEGALNAAYRHGYGAGGVDEAGEVAWGPYSAAAEYMKAPPHGITELFSALEAMERDREAMEEIYQSEYSCADYARATAGEALGLPTDKVGGGRRCEGTTRQGLRCLLSAVPHSDYCSTHGEPILGKQEKEDE